MSDNNGSVEASSAPATEPEVQLSPEEQKAQVAKLVAEGKKAIALKQWEEGVAKYADALDIQKQLVGDFDPSMAPLLLSYGRALYELALSQSGVMGKEEVAKGTDPAVAAEAAAESEKNGKFVFEGDGDEEEEEEDDEAEGGEQEGGEDGDEPEDDFNAAWEVLDVARTIYERKVADMSADEGREDRLNLSETYLTLGDVSLETENFPQAVQDYTAALKIKEALLPPSSRALASAHYQLGTVLEFTPSGRSVALKHVQAALDGFKLRASELAGTPAEGSDIAALSKKEREVEAKDVAGLIADLEVKIDELKSAPEEQDIVTQSINHLLGGVGSAPAAADSGPVNDLTSMVKKRKPKPKPEEPVKKAKAE